MPCGWRPSCWSVQGGTTGGRSLYAHEGHLTYCYNFVGARYFFIFLMDETTEVGNDAGAPVSEDYGPTGTPSPARSLGSSSTSPPTPTPTT
jgi:hypothetical protein